MFANWFLLGTTTKIIQLREKGASFPLYERRNYLVLSSSTTAKKDFAGESTDEGAVVCLTICSFTMHNRNGASVK